MQARGTNIKKSQLDGLATLANASPIPKLKWRFFNRPSSSGENSYFLEPLQSQDFKFKDRAAWVESTDSWLAELSRIRANIQRYYSTRQTPVLPATNLKQVKQVGVSDGLRNRPARFLKNVRFVTQSQGALAQLKIGQLPLSQIIFNSTQLVVEENGGVARGLVASYKFGLLFSTGTNKLSGELTDTINFASASQVDTITVSGAASSWVNSLRVIDTSPGNSAFAFKLSDGHPSEIELTITVTLKSGAPSFAYVQGNLYLGGYWLNTYAAQEQSKDISSARTYFAQVTDECPAAFDASKVASGLETNPRVFDNVEITANAQGYWLADCPMINGLSMDPPARGGVLHPNAYDYGPIPYDTKITGLKVIDYLDRGLHSHISQMIYDQPPLYPWQRDTDTGLSAPNISGRCIYKVVAKRIATEKSGARGAAITVEIGCIQGGTFNTFETVTIDANKPASDAIYPNWIIFDTSRIAYRCAQKVEIYANVYEPINIAQSDWPYGFRLSGQVLADWLNDTEAILQSIT